MESKLGISKPLRTVIGYYKVVKFSFIPQACPARFLVKFISIHVRKIIAQSGFGTKAAAKTMGSDGICSYILTGVVWNKRAYSRFGACLVILHGKTYSAFQGVVVFFIFPVSLK